MYSEGTDPALLIAAQNAHENVLQILINHSKTDICVSGTYGTILHTILWQPMPHKSYERSLYQIISSEHTRRQLRFVMIFFKFSGYCISHSMAGANLNKSKKVLTFTTTASKYIPKRPRICIS